MIINKIKSKIAAFTLVEILVVLSIIGVITIFSAVNGPTQLAKARDAVRKSHVDRIKKSIEEYYQDKNCYPTAIPACGNSFLEGSTVLIDKIPCDPTNSLSYTYVPETSNCPKSYQLYANLEYLADRIIDKIECRNGCGPDCQFNYGVASPNEKLNPFCLQSATPAPQESISQYVCAPNGTCEVYVDPEISDCPNVYVNDETCQNTCSDPKQRCHDARGKVN
ncbi:MAG: type II secretion system protein [Microgenomates group bacterium]